MHKSILSTIILAIILFMTISGCGNSAGPTAPDPGTGDLAYPVNPSVSGRYETLLGLYDITIDPLTCTADIVPERGAMFELNILKFIQPPVQEPPLMSLEFLPDTNVQEGYIDVNIGITHPLPDTHFIIFDVIGIFMPAEGDLISTIDPTLDWPSPNQAKLLNADGYTRWWNQVEFTTDDTLFGYTEWWIAPHFFTCSSKLNPFKYYADGLGPDDPFDREHLIQTDRGSFTPSQPGFNERRYQIQFPKDVTVDYRFKFGVSASFALPNPGWIPPISPDDFPITANRPEPVMVTVQDTGSSAWYNSPSDYGGDLSFELTLLDWQGGTTLTGTMDEFSGIYAESPTLFDGVIDLMVGSEWGPPEPGDPSFQMWCYLPDVTPVTTTQQEILITVVSANPTDYSVQIPGFSGFDYPEGAALASYFVWQVPIQSQQWVEKASTPKAGGFGESVASTGSYIYIIRNTNVSYLPQFWRYDPTMDSWLDLSIEGLSEGAFRNGTTLTWENDTEYLYALGGARYSDIDRRQFFRYSITDDNWTQLADTPHAQGAGDAADWSGYDYKLYAILGSKEHDTAFARYDAFLDTWDVLESPLALTDDGASLTWTGGQFLYALYGEYEELIPKQDFWRYDILDNSWTQFQDIPEFDGVGDGGSLIWIGDWDNFQMDYIYALGGGTVDEQPGYGFYRYSISSNAWETLPAIPFPVGYYNGNRLGFASGYIYYWQGSPTTYPGGGNRFARFEW